MRRLMALLFISDFSSHQFRSVPRPSEWGVPLLLLLAWAGAAVVSMFAWLRPYAAYALAVGSLGCVGLWHAELCVTSFNFSFSSGHGHACIVERSVVRMDFLRCFASSGIVLEQLVHGLVLRWVLCQRQRGETLASIPRGTRWMSVAEKRCESHIFEGYSLIQ